MPTNCHTSPENRDFKLNLVYVCCMYWTFLYEKWDNFHTFWSWYVPKASNNRGYIAKSRFEKRNPDYNFNPTIKQNFWPFIKHYSVWLSSIKQISTGTLRATKRQCEMQENSRSRSNKMSGPCVFVWCWYRFKWCFCTNFIFALWLF